MNSHPIHRTLPVALTRDEKITFGYRLAQLHEDYQNVEAAKKAAAENFKEQLDHLDARISHLARIVRAGEEPRDVECVWRYLFETNSKELIRTDTGEVIETKAIEAAERQLLLQINQEAEATEAAKGPSDPKGAGEHDARLSDLKSRGAAD